jgi:hypothetical protein
MASSVDFESQREKEHLILSPVAWFECRKRNTNGQVRSSATPARDPNPKICMYLVPHRMMRYLWGGIHGNYT